MHRITIKGMNCQHCVASVTQALSAIPGITEVKVDLQKGEVTFSGNVEMGTVREAIQKIGFEVE